MVTVVRGGVAGRKYLYMRWFIVSWGGGRGDATWKGSRGVLGMCDFRRIEGVKWWKEEWSVCVCVCV